MIGEGDRVPRMGLPLLDGPPHAVNGLLFVRVDVQGDVVGAGGQGGDQRALQHLVGCPLQ